MHDTLKRLQWSIFGNMNIALLTLLTTSVYVTGYFLPQIGQQVLFGIGGLAVGLLYVMVLYRSRVLYRKARRV